LQRKGRPIKAGLFYWLTAKTNQHPLRALILQKDYKMSSFRIYKLLQTFRGEKLIQNCHCSNCFSTFATATQKQKAHSNSL